MSPAASPQLDALVVGAGWAGLQCALQLAQAGKRVVCLEARKRLGGRAFTHTWDDNTPMDNSERQAAAAGAGAGGSRAYAVDFGCSYIHGYNEGNPVKDIAKKYGIPAHIPKPTKAQVVGVRGALPAALSDKLQSNLSEAQEAAKQLGRQRREQAASSDGKLAAKDSLASAILASDSPLFKDLASDEERQMALGLAGTLHVPLGTDLDQVALDYFGSEANFAGTDAMPEGGFTALLSRVAEDFKQAGGQMRLGEVASRVVAKQKQQGVEITTHREDGSQECSYQAKAAIVTAPLAVLKKQMDIFEPALSMQRQNAIARTAVGNLNKVLLTYKEPWWPLDIGTFHVLPTKTPSTTGGASSLQDIFATSSLIVSSLCAPNGLPEASMSPSLLVMVGGAQARQLESYDRLTTAAALSEYLYPRLSAASGDTSSSSSSSSSRPPALAHAFYSRWARQAFTGGATTTPVTLHNSPRDFVTLATPDWDGALFFAGEHCHPDHRGSVAGAVVSANDTAQAVLRHLEQQATTARY